MAWVKLDDDFFSNPKVLRAGRDARDLYLAALCFCNRGLTDGFVPAEALRRLGVDADVDDVMAAVTALCTVGLWRPEATGYRIHQYLDYQPSAEAVTAKREAAAERMRSVRSREVRANKSRTSREVRSTPTQPQPVPIPHPYDGENAPLPPADGGGAAKAKRPTRIDPDWEPDAALLAWCAGKRFGQAEIAEQAERFRDHYVAKGEARADWSASFRNWMTSPIRQQERARSPTGSNGSGGRTGLPFDGAAERLRVMRESRGERARDAAGVEHDRRALLAAGDQTPGGDGADAGHVDRGAGDPGPR